MNVSVDLATEFDAPPPKNFLTRFFQWAERGRGSVLLGVFAAAEGLGLPIPPDLLLVGMATGAPGRTKRLVAVATLGAVLGGAGSYAIGSTCWESLRPHMADQLAFAGLNDEGLRNAHADYVKLGWWSSLFAGLRPVVYQRYAFAAGVFRSEQPFGPFLLAAAISHALRFLLIGGLAAFFADFVRPSAGRRPWTTVVISLLIAAVAVAWGVVHR